MEHLREQTDCKFLLRTPIEPDIIASMPAFDRLQAKMGSETVSLVAAGAEEAENYS